MNLHNLLHAAGRRVLISQLACALFVSASVLLATLLVILVMDAVFALAPVALIVVDALMLGLFGALAVHTFRCLRRNQFNTRRMARLIESRLGLKDNPLINAVEFREEGTATGSQLLAQDAIERGENTASTISAGDAIDYRPMWRSTGAIAACLAIVLVAYFLAPLVFARGLARFLDPTGGHPPFSLVNFDVTVTPDPIYFGSPATIMAELNGPVLPEQADVVFVDTREPQRVPMLRNDAGSYLLYVEQAAETRDFYIDTPQGRSRVHRLQVNRVPRLETANVDYHFPSYTGWPATGHLLELRGIRALVGTNVDVVATSNLPLGGGEIELLSPDGEDILTTVTLSPSGSDGHSVGGQFELAASGRFRLSIQGVDGVAGLEPLEGKIVAVPDRAPLIDIVEPEPHLVVVENWNIPVSIRASDDVKIDRVELNMSVNGWAAPVNPLLHDTADGRVAHAFYEFDLEPLGAKAGDMISYYATAFDNHPDGGQFTDTSTYLIQIISPDEYEDLARRNYRADNLEKEIKELRKKLDDLQQQRKEVFAELDALQQALARGELDDAGMQRLERLQDQLQEYNDQLQRLTKEMRERADQQQLYDFEQPYVNMLNSMADRLEQQAATAQYMQEAAAGLASNPSSPSAQDQFDQALEQLQNESAPFEEQDQQQLELTQVMIEMFRKVDEMLASSDRIRAVIHQQRELADRMQQFHSLDNITSEQQRRMDQFAKQQELLREELEQAVNQLQQAAEQAQDDLPRTSGDAMELCQAIRDQGVFADQDTAAEMARSGIASSAHDSAEQAAQKLESLLSDCCNPQGMAGEMPLDPGLNMSRQQAMNSLRQMAQGRQLPGLQQGNKSGRQGRGQAGSMSRMTIRGPHHDSQGNGGGPSRIAGAQAKGGTRRGGSTSPLSAAESISADPHGSARDATGNLRGVPVGYRDQAEAYFRRLTEEQ